MSARLLFCLAVLSLGVCASGLSADSGADKFSPETYGIGRYQGIWKRSPFIKETVVATQSPGLASKYALVGIASIGKQQVVFLIDRSEPDPGKNRFMVSQGKIDPPRNIEILSVAMSKDPRNSKITIKQGGEQADLPFDASTLPPTGPVGAQGGAPNVSMPGIAGGVPGGGPRSIRSDGGLNLLPPPTGNTPGMPATQPNQLPVPQPPGATPSSVVPPVPGIPPAVNPSQPQPTPSRRIIRPKPINVN